MTIILDRPVTIDLPTPTVPTVDIAAAVAAGCPDGVPWCAGDPDWHDDGQGVHDSQFVIVPIGDPRCSRHDEGASDRGATEIWLAIGRDDSADGEPAAPHIYLSPASAEFPSATCEDAHMGVDEAEQLAYELLRLVAAARGSKRAQDIRPGDVLVLGGVEQTATVVLLDSECCPNRETGGHECAGSVSVETDASGEGEWAGTFDLDDLVPVHGGQADQNGKGPGDA